MAAYNGSRRAPNVSQYIANLNTIPSAQDVAEQADFDIANDGLDFLNTDFFDFDATAFEQNNAFLPQSQAAAPPPPVVPQQAAAVDPTFQYAELQNYPQQTFSQSPTHLTQTPTTTTFPVDFSQPAAVDAANGQLQLVAGMDDSSRAAAEEDKRRRNTAASARFRVKKKQREQALEQRTKEMQDKVSQLETKVHQLELENKWLKGLITEKSDTKATEEQFRKFVAERKADDKKTVETIAESRNDGVGTEVDA